MEISVKKTASIWFVQVWLVLDSDTIEIYGGCQYGFTPLNSIGDKSNGAFEEKIVDYGLEFRRKLKTDKLADI